MNRRAHEPADLSALSGCAAELAEVFVSLASDIALVIDDSGVITRVAQSAGTPMSPAAERWVGRHWADTVTGETRRKIELLLNDAASSGLARRREVNHGSDGGGDIPVAYTALRLGKGGPVLAVGRDLRAIAAIQQRFHDTQQELERSYWKARQAESHHDLLVQVATDAVLVVDALTLLIVEADATASELLAHGAPLCGQPALQPFDAASRGPVRELLLSARSTGRPAEIHARLAGDSHAMVIAAAPFRARDGMRLLVRVRPLGAASAGGAETRRVQTWRAERLSEAVVVTDSGGKVLAANPPTTCRRCWPACTNAASPGSAARRSAPAQRSPSFRSRPPCWPTATRPASASPCGPTPVPGPRRHPVSVPNSRRRLPSWPPASVARRWTSCCCRRSG